MDPGYRGRAMETELSRISRYEMKYAVSEEQAAEIRDYIQPIFSLDQHAGSEQGGYTVNSVYMDTPSLRFYYDTRLRLPTRLKPRVRYYGTRPAEVAVMEVKHRHNRTIWKTRHSVPVDEWPAVLEVSGSDRTSPSYTNVAETFVDVHHLYGTAPVLHVRYSREPYVSEIDEYARITFDRGMRYRLMRGSYELACSDEEMLYYDDPITAQWDDSPVVMEIKTESFVPAWAIDLIRRFSLVQRGYSKYRYVIDRCLENVATGTDLAV